VWGPDVVEFLKIKPISKIPYIHLSFSLSTYTSADFGLGWGKRFCIRLEKRPRFALRHYYTILLFVFFFSPFFSSPKEKRNFNFKSHWCFVRTLEGDLGEVSLCFPCVFPIRLALKYSLRLLLSVESCADGMWFFSLLP